MDLCELVASPVYTVSSETPRVVIERKPVLKKTKVIIIVILSDSICIQRTQIVPPFHHIASRGPTQVIRLALLPSHQPQARQVKDEETEVLGHRL